MEKLLQMAYLFKKAAEEQPYSACVLILNDDSKILGVARRGTTDAWGLPGGKLELNENPKLAAARETVEETGVVVAPHDLIPLYFAVDDDGHRVQTFLAKKWSGEARQGDAGPVKWLSPRELLSGPYGQYNTEMLEALLKT